MYKVKNIKYKGDNCPKKKLLNSNTTGYQIWIPSISMMLCISAGEETMK